MSTHRLRLQTVIPAVLLMLALTAIVAFRLLAAQAIDPQPLVTITLTPQEAAAVAALIQRQNEDNAKMTPPGPVYTTETFFRERLDPTIRDAIRSQPSVDRRNIQEDAAKLSPQDAAEIAALIRQKLGGGGGAGTR